MTDFVTTQFRDASAGDICELVRCAKCRVGRVFVLKRGGSGLADLWREKHMGECRG